MMDSSVPLVAIAMSRALGSPIVAFESYEDGSTENPTLVHVAVSHDGGFVDDEGFRSFAEVVAGLKGATFRSRTIDVAEATRIAADAPKRSTIDVEERVEAIKDCLRIRLDHQNAGSMAL